MKRASYDPRAHGAKCDVCPLNGGAVVPPSGASTADFVIVGEGPGANEVREGKPFVGASGVKLNEILKAAGISRAQCYITNAVLCRAEVPGEQGAKRFEVKRFMAWIRKENARRKKEAMALAANEIKEIKKFIRKVEKRQAAGEQLPEADLFWLQKAHDRLATIYTPIPTPFECCWPRLRNELHWFEAEAQNRHRLHGDRPNGAIVLPLGNFAAQAVLGKTTGIMKLRGAPAVVHLEGR